MTETTRLTTPIGRLVNGSLFEKDAYKDERGHEATPSYKIEMAFDEVDIEALENAVVEAAIAEWGAGAEQDYEDGIIRSPILEGDDLAKKRQEKGKSGDAYEGKVVVRASTIYNRHGEDAPGGVYVCDENAKELDFAERGKIYNGCHGIAALAPQAYSIDGRKGVTFYLQGFQFVKDGDPLRGVDPSSLFTATVSAASEGKGRRRRGGRS